MPIPLCLLVFLSLTDCHCQVVRTKGGRLVLWHSRNLKGAANFTCAPVSLVCKWSEKAPLSLSSFLPPFFACFAYSAFAVVEAAAAISICISPLDDDERRELTSVRPSEKSGNMNSASDGRKEEKRESLNKRQYFLRSHRENFSLSGDDEPPNFVGLVPRRAFRLAPA